MCGIAGGVGPGVGDDELLARMIASLAHRGPDGVGTFVDLDAMLGACRLAIIDVEGGAQPIFNETGEIAVVCNGEIYNFLELRRQLEARGHRFTTGSDSECLVHLYEDYGVDAVHHLRGMFAFAIWDRRQHRLVLGRDRMGKKPLFYRREAGRLWFASEPKALCQDRSFVRRLDPVALDHYLALLYVPAPLSIYQGVEKLAPGHTLTFCEGELSVQRYWELAFEPKLEISEPEAIEELETVLREATRLRMVSERPVGAFLSGGVDSALVVATMAGLQSEPIKTFSVGFDDESCDERPYARVVAERFGTDHHEVVVRPSPAVALDAPTRFYDEPFGDPSAIACLELARVAAPHVTVALNGDGGDEAFAGYGRYAAALLAGRLPMPRPLARAALGVVRPMTSDARPGSVPSKLRAGLEFQLARGGRGFPPMSRAFSRRQRQALYSTEMRATTVDIDPLCAPRALVASSRATNDVDRLLLADFESYLPGNLMPKIDIATMSRSIEARSPFLDHELMEFAARLPVSFKVRRSGSSLVGKYLLKRVARSTLPDDIVHRRKVGFEVPVGRWLRNELHDAAHDLLTDRVARDRGLFDPGAVDRLLDAHDGGADHALRLWGLVRFELWARNWLDCCGP